MLFRSIFSHKKNYLSSGKKLNDQSAKKRFIGYLEPDKGLQEKKIRMMGIHNGIEGIHINIEENGKDFKITAKYKILFWFNFFGSDGVEMEQSFKARKWK